MEKSLVLVKPDGIQRGLIGEIISRFERKGLKLIGVKMMSLDDTILEAHYSHLVDKPFFWRYQRIYEGFPGRGDGLGRRHWLRGCYPYLGRTY